MVWMLRSVEAAAVKVRHVKLDWSERKVELTIPKSKMDQAGKGVRRTLACCGASVCGRACAWWLAVRALSEAGSSEEGPLFPMTGGGRCSRLQLVASWQKELDGDMTGHSGRRSGAMMYARNGLQLFDFAFLGRWKSSAVMRYIEEAMEQLAINQRAVANQQVPYSNAGVLCQITPGAAGRDKVPEEKGDSRPGDKAVIGITELEDMKENEESKLEKKIVKKPQEIPKQNQKLWAISRSRAGRTRHWVNRASWGIALEEWSTACGWHFARANVKVELTRNVRQSSKSATVSKEVGI